MEVISLKLDENMLNNIDKNLSKHNYSTRTEFVRDAVREKLEKMTREELVQEFLKIKVHSKDGKRVTDADLRKAREEAYNELVKERGWKLD